LKFLTFKGVNSLKKKNVLKERDACVGGNRVNSCPIFDGKNSNPRSGSFTAPFHSFKCLVPFSLFIGIGIVIGILVVDKN
jgi:hypothetical protein